jgi:hypothetical protein
MMRQLKRNLDEPLLNKINNILTSEYKLVFLNNLCSVTVQLYYFRLADTWITSAIILHWVII